MKRLMLTAMTITLFAGLAPRSWSKGDPAKGKTNFQICMACHGLNGEGNKALNVPVNGGQMESYILRQLKNFRAGIRGVDQKDLYGMQMRPMAMALADDQAVEDVAAYVASLTPAHPPATVEGDAAKGKEKYLYCFGCHGEKGEGSELFASPKLAGQHDWFIVRQLTHFKDGVRGGKPEDAHGAAMALVTKTLLNEEDIKNLAAYIATLKR